MLYEIYMSFTDYSNKNLRQNSPAPNWIGLDNYTTIFNTSVIDTMLPNFDFLRIIIFNLWWAFSNGVFHLIIGVLVALLLNIEGLWFRRIYRAIFILPVAIPAIIVATIWRNVFDQDGPANALLRFCFGFFGNFDINWLSNSDFDPSNESILNNIFSNPYWALLVANIWVGWPLYSVVATSILQSMPHDLQEAAVVDGAGSLQRFFNITMPLLYPAMLPYALFGFITTFNLFHLSYFMSGGAPFSRTELLVTQAYKLVQANPLYGLASAFAVYTFLVLLIISLLVNRLTKFTGDHDIDT
jgi:arabinogalactan oligomer/maltooligosaccharide transport system permease protein